MSALLVLKFPFLDREILVKAIEKAGLHITSQNASQISVGIPNMPGYDFQYEKTDIGYSCQIRDFVKQNAQNVNKVYMDLYNDKKRRIEEERQRRMEEEFESD